MQQFTGYSWKYRELYVYTYINIHNHFIYICILYIYTYIYTYKCLPGQKASSSDNIENYIYIYIYTVKPPSTRSPFARNSDCAHLFLFQLPCNALLRLQLHLRACFLYSIY